MKKFYRALSDGLFHPVMLTLQVVCAGLSCFGDTADQETVIARERPNIVWLVTEDNSVHYLSLYTAGGAPMPAVERLAESGLTFDRAYANGPVCSTARSALISGCYGPRTFTQYHRASVQVPMPDGLHMFPWYLREAGYYATNNAKEDYNFIKGEGVWDDSSPKASYRNRAPNQPFFHVQNFGTTHEGRLHFPVSDVERVGTSTRVEAVPLFPEHPDTALFHYTNARYRDLHMKVDREIGAFIEQLEADGLLADTIVFYFGDHGGVLPGSKGYLYQTGLHVPLVVHIPPKWRTLAPWPAGSRVAEPVQFVDFGPTVLCLAGLDRPAKMDGRPFLGDRELVPEAPGRRAVFAYADRFDEKYDMVRAVIKGRYKYIRRYQPYNADGLHNEYRYRMAAYDEWRRLYREGGLNAIQARFFEPQTVEALYDLQTDPHETRNLADDPTLAAILRELRGDLRAWIVAMPDLGFFPEPVLAMEATDPESFGRSQQSRIAGLLDLADLALEDWKQAHPMIAAALAGEDAMKRYWAWIVCSCFGEKAIGLVGQAEVAARSDPDLLVRLRAAEFIGLTGQGDPRPYLLSILGEAESELEAGFILNTFTLFHDRGWVFDLNPADYPAIWFKGDKSNVARRFSYLNRSLAQ